MLKTISSKNVEKKFKIALLTGGPSLERGISLNSARSVLDHLSSENIEIVPVYFDQKKRAFKISRAELYSNNPSDFDFKLVQNFSSLNQKSLIKLLKSTDIIFPAMHGPFGEDGQIQTFLEKNKIPFIGSGSVACKKAFDKYNAHKTLQDKGFLTLPSGLLKIYSKDNKRIIEEFFIKNKIERAIIKPASGGSSIGVFSTNTPEEALEKANILFSKRMDTRIVLEPFAEGREFTVIILQNKIGMPVALLPSEIEMAYHESRIFDFRKKYLPTNQVKYHCPARFSNEVIEKIQIEAKQLFSLFKMKDFARFDGWLLPNGEILFSDFNPISGMEQNSFLFQQASRLSMSHSDLLRYVVKNSCQRQGINFSKFPEQEKIEKKTVSVIFGGRTSERQVSLMTGTNVWLKLRRSDIYNPKPYLLDFENNVWELPYAFILNHTVEEVITNVKNATIGQQNTENIIKKIKTELLLKDSEATEPFFVPHRISFHEFVKKSKFIFLGLHGGDGENGNFQKILAGEKVKFNGSPEKTSRLCMDKFATGEFVRNAGIKGISIIPQRILSLKDLLVQADINVNRMKEFWHILRSTFNSKTIIVKPKSDGCSTGVAHLHKEADLKNYLKYLINNDSFIPKGILSNQKSIIEMPNEPVKEILFEKFINTDSIHFKGNKLKYTRKNGWIEVTIGILEIDKKLHAFNPSLTIAEEEILSVEEKFQGGTGINITPPPTSIIKPRIVLKTRKLAEELAKRIGIKGYARIDAFMNVTTGTLIVIEVNTLPALTPSTVLYHQALAENPQIFPLELLEKIIKNAGY